MGVLEEREGPRPGGVLVLVQGLGLVGEGRVTEGGGRDGERSLSSNVQLEGLFLVVGSVQVHILHPEGRAGVCVRLLAERLVEQGVGDLAGRG